MNSEVLVIKLRHNNFFNVHFFNGLSNLCLYTNTSVTIKACVLGAGMFAAGAFSGAAFAQSFDDGVEAYLAGRYVQALEIWTPLAGDNDAVAMFNIGVLYAQGLGVNQDPVVAVDWYRKAADRGYAPAQFNLGASYHNGQGVTRDDELAASWWQLAADQGEVQAQYHLAVLYLEGRGVSQDENTARYFLEQAARQGDSRAAETLGSLSAGATDAATNETINAEPSANASENSGVNSDVNSDDNTSAAPEQAAAGSAAAVSESETVGTATDQAPETVTGIVADSGEATIEEVDTTNAVIQPTVVTTENGATVIYTTESAQLTASEGAASVQVYDPGSFTIQLLATQERQSAENFVRSNGLEDRAHIFLADIGENPLYKVIYGNFATSAEAKQERKGLPSALMANTPWIRDLASVQAEASAATVATTNAGSTSDIVVTQSDTANAAENESNTIVSDATEINETEIEKLEEAEVIPIANAPEVSASSQSTNEAQATAPSSEVSESTSEAVADQSQQVVVVEQVTDDSVTPSTETAVLTVTEPSVQENESTIENVVENTIENSTDNIENTAEIIAETTVEASEPVVIDSAVTSTRSEAVTESVVAQTTSAAETAVESNSVEPAVAESVLTEATSEQATAEQIVVETAETEQTQLPTSETTSETISETSNSLLTDDAESTAITEGTATTATDAADMSNQTVVVSEQVENAPVPSSAESSETAISSETTTVAAVDQNVDRAVTPEPGQQINGSQSVENFTLGQRAFNRQDYETALGHWRPLAESGHAEAQYGLGFMYETGWGVQRDASDALEWYRKSAEQGYAKAQYNLGMMFLVGNGVPADESMGLFWIQSAADQNDLRARARLSRMRANSDTKNN